MHLAALSIGFGSILRKILLHLWLAASALLHKFIILMGCGGHPWPRYKHLRNLSAPTSLDNLMTYYIFCNSISCYINTDIWIIQFKKLVYQNLVHMLLLKNYHEESRSSSAATYHSFNYPTN